MTDDNEFIVVKQASEVEVTYSKIVNHQLSQHGQCDEYNLDRKPANFNTKNDCVFGCVKAQYESECLYWPIYHMDIPLRRPLLPGSSPTKECDTSIGESESLELIDACMTKCKEECHQEYYLCENKVIRQYPNLSVKSYRTIKIDFIPSNLPDIIINHMPEMTFLSVLCNFGGLVGMWLGVSVFATFKNFAKLSKTLFNNLTSSNFIQQNNFHIDKASFNFKGRLSGFDNRKVFINTRYPYTTSNIYDLAR